MHYSAGPGVVSHEFCDIITYSVRYRIIFYIKDMQCNSTRTTEQNVFSQPCLDAKTNLWTQNYFLLVACFSQRQWTVTSSSCVIVRVIVLKNWFFCNWLLTFHQLERKWSSKSQKLGQPLRNYLQKKVPSKRSGYPTEALFYWQNKSAPVDADALLEYKNWKSFPSLSERNSAISWSWSISVWLKFIAWQ